MKQVYIVENDEIKAIHNEISELRQLLGLVLDKTQAQQRSNSNEGLLSIPKAAKRAGVGLKTFVKAINEGLINPTKTHYNGHLRIHPDEVERYMRSVQVESVLPKQGRPPQKYEFIENIRSAK